MIELRWVPLERSSDDASADKGYPDVKDGYGMYMVLQYRQNNQFPREGGDWGDDWSDWIDVPTVTEPNPPQT